MKFLIVFALIVLVAQVHSTPSIGKIRIVNGENAGSKQFPFMASLRISQGNNAYVVCGGTLISKEWVITAAHCVSGKNGDIHIRLGSTNFDSTQTEVTVPASNAIVYPFYECAGLATDIALIKMPAVTLSDTIQPIKLPAYSAPLKSYANEDALIIGWGGTYSGSPIPKNLQFGNVKIISQEECGKQLDLKDSIMCATSLPSSTCSGDSGGPLVLKSENILVGVTSFGINGCASGFPSGFARITSFLWWIKITTGVSY